MSLDTYANHSTARPRRASSYDRTGANIDALTDLAPGSTTVLMESDGPGRITHIWATMMEYPGHETLARDLVLRIYWEHSPVPSVEVPIGDFFGLGHALTPQFYERRKFILNSMPLTVGGNERAMNCYWPMPFRQHARVEIFNSGTVSAKLFYYHVDYELGEQPTEALLFHANFKQDLARQGQAPGYDYENLHGRDNFVLLETEARGHYAGCLFYIDTDAGGWWGEGDDMIFIDHSPMPVIYGTGSEDYFCNAWGFREPFCFPYFGAPLLVKRPDGGEWTTVYRFHIPDPVHFQEHVKVTLECWWEPEKTNAIASVAFWYQDKPISYREPLPAGAANHPRRHELAKEDRWDHGPQDPKIIYFHPHEFEAPLLQAGEKVRTVNRIGPRFIYLTGSSGGIVLESSGREIELPLSAPAGLYRVEIKPLYSSLQGFMRLRIGDIIRETGPETSGQIEDELPFLDFGEIESRGTPIILHISGNPVAAIHGIRLTRST